MPYLDTSRKDCCTLSRPNDTHELTSPQRRMPFPSSNEASSWCLVYLLLLGLTAAKSQADESVSFTEDIRPILSDHCFACHGPDSEHRAAGLRLDNSEGIHESGVVNNDDVEASELWARVVSDDSDTVMPPPEYNKPLDEKQRELIRRWIVSGAQYEQHWAFVTPTKPPVPDNSATHPVDAFLKEKLNAAELDFSPPTDRQNLIRRATLDLTGLPPTPDEVKAFVGDEDPMAYEKLLEGLMSRPTYGEQLARHWLDLARYADTHGLHLDNERSMWPYRDWVVRAFNQNLPFDEFTRWQLAGDLLEAPTREHRIASGFNRCNVTTSEGGSINEEWVFRYAVDRTTTMAEVWMGLTAGCAVCHDHKFDPISTQDYYSLYAFFHSAADPAMDGNKIDTPPILRLYNDEEKQRIAKLKDSLADVSDQVDQKLRSFDYQDPALLDPLPAPEVTEKIWFEDGFPKGAKTRTLGGPLTLVSKSDSNVFAGTRALRRTAKALEQDFYSAGAKPFVIANQSKLFVHCFLDPKDKPDAIMIQFHSDQWKHRAVWGQHEKIPFGTVDTPSKQHLGALPEAGRWVRLEIDAEQIGLSEKTKVTGFAFTQFGGTVTWDHLGIGTKTDRAKESSWSWKIWKETFGGKRVADLPTGLQKLVRAKHPKKWTDAEHERIFKHWLRHIYAGIDEIIGDLDKREKQVLEDIAAAEKDVPLTLVMADLDKPRDSFVMMRGQYDNPGKQVTRDVPNFLPPLPHKEAGADHNRLDLADWLVSGNHPLTARVTVNRFWQQLFGTGIVATSGDFGSQGEPPSHGKLLDYLAVDFVENNWDVHRLLKLLMTSNAYRQSSFVSMEARNIDPSNRLLSHFPRLRLDAEVLRDQALFVSDLLVSQIGGQPVKPYQPPNIWEPVGFGRSNTRYYTQDHGDALYRRSLYTFLKRTAPPPFMSTFDAPNREQSCTRRGRSNTPLQALQLMNDIQYVEAARHFAAKIIQLGGDRVDTRIEFAWKQAVGRKPTMQEQRIATRMVHSFEQRYKADLESAKALVQYGESGLGSEFDEHELAAYTILANVLFNLDEFVTKN